MSKGWKMRCASGRGVLALATGLLVIGCRAGATAQPPRDLRVEDQPGWVVTDEPVPRLSWVPAAEVAAGKPVAQWEIQATLRGESVGLPEQGVWLPAPWPVEDGPWRVWDGPLLGSRSEVKWRVRGLAADGTAGEWSEPAVFESGMRAASDWGYAQWIGMRAERRERSAPWLRRGFTVAKPVVRARLYVCGLGYHEAWLNGQRLGDAVLEPGQTDYDRRCFYVAHDVTKLVKEGQNAVGVWLGDGFFNQDRVWGEKGLSYGEPRLLARLEMVHADGTRSAVVSDGTWKCARSAVVESNVYQGEHHDARLDCAWSAAEFSDVEWEPVAMMEAPGGVLLARECPPCKRMASVPVVAVSQPEPGVKVHDFGRNFTGWARLRVKAPAGTRITMTFAETLAPKGGGIDTLSTGVPHTKVEQRDIYVCKGGGEETWEPRFTWHGFRYAEVRVEGGQPESLTLEGVALHTELPVTGEFECDNPLVMKILDAAHWTQVSNIVSLPMDCPVRERCGWTGDAHLCVPFTLCRYQSAALWRKYLNDILTGADREGITLAFGKGFDDRKQIEKPRGIPHMIAPGLRTSGIATPDWGSAIVFIPWGLYQHTGDPRWIRRNADTMRQWTDWVAEQRDDDGIVRNGLGDWCKPWPRTGPRPESGPAYYGEMVPQLSTACLFRCASILADVARMLGNADEELRFLNLAEETRVAFVQAFRDPKSGSFGDQTANAIAVRWGLADETQAKQAAGVLAKQVAAEDFHFMTGVFGLPALWPVLASYGHEETAWKALQTPTAPGFADLFRRGATSLWETWPNQDDDGKSWERSMSHPFQGAMAAWFYQGIAGIRPSPVTAGFREFRMQPQMTGFLTDVKCRQLTAMGWIGSAWRREGTRVTWDIEVPPGARAELRVPGKVVEVKGCVRKGEGSTLDAAAGLGTVVFVGKR